MDPALPPASELLAAMVSEMGELYGDIEGDHMPSAKPADFAPPAGAFLVGFHDGQPVCAGGIKRIAPDAAEIKRMYVVPAARRRGLARTLLRALEDAARERGYAWVRLDTVAAAHGDELEALVIVDSRTELTDRDVCAKVRAALSDEQAEWVEEVAVATRTPAAALPAVARERIGVAGDQENLLVRVVLRHPTRSLAKAEANALRDRIYAALHEGSGWEWAVTRGAEGGRPARGAAGE